MSNAEGEDCIAVPTKLYIDESLNSRCGQWDLALSKLRAEWTLEHKNLIQRFESAEHAKDVAKTAVDEHFQVINGLQNRMDKLSASFVTKEELDRRMSAQTRNFWAILIGAAMALTGAFVTHLAGKL